MKREWCRQCGRWVTDGHEKKARFARFHDTSPTWEHAIRRLPVPA